MIKDRYTKFNSSGGGACPVGATIMKTGQTTSYRTADDGDIEPGRATSHTVLASNNPFGNTNRFTDELGGSTYTNNIVIDWSTFDGNTVLGIYRTNLSTVTNVTWDAAVDNAAAVSIGSFTTGWRLWNMNEAQNFRTYATYSYNFAPLNSGAVNYGYWVSNSYPFATTNAYVCMNIGHSNIVAKSGASGGGVAVRYFTVTGTVLS